MFYEPTGALHSTSENAERFGYCEVLLTGRQQVTFTGTPATIASSMARTPSRVPGILINKFGRRARSNNSLAAETVQAVSWANSGETSNETQPSTLLVPSWVGRKKPAARVTSSSASSRKSGSTDSPSRSFSRIGASYSLLFLMTWSKIVGFEVSPVIDSSSM
jgi:hypothetical protein